VRVIEGTYADPGGRFAIGIEAYGLRIVERIALAAGPQGR